jgi:hypothetical protein
MRKALRPQLAWNVGHNANAITLTINVTTSVTHASKTLNGAFDVTMSGLTAFTHGTDQSTCIAFTGINRMEIQVIE